jgi:gamma-glutamyltranspeptidase / glutathione hydrolase
MNHTRHRLMALMNFGIAALVASILITAQSASAAEPALADAGRATCMVATVHPIATDAGVRAFEAGGNAVDAAVAAAVTLGVVDSYNSGLGGGCFILIRSADGKFVAIDGRETAPAAARRDMYLRDGKAQPELSQTGALAVATPGALAAYQMAIEKHGRRKLSELMLPAAAVAENGYEISGLFAERLKSKAKELEKFPGSRAALLKPDGSPYFKGEVLRQPDLAKSYRAIAEQGVDWFYRGAFAEQVSKWMKEHGGILTAADFAKYRPTVRAPLVTTYRDWTIVGFPPPSSGGVHVAQILNILEQFDLSEEYRRDPARAFHLIASAMQLAFADRAHWLGDADFVQVPRGLIDKEYAKKLAKQIDLVNAIDPQHGTPPAAEQNLFGKPSKPSPHGRGQGEGAGEVHQSSQHPHPGPLPAGEGEGRKHTTHIAAADSEGNWVAITATINTTFGSKVIVPGTGIVLNNEMDDFSIEPGVPNAFKLIGAENNAVAPGKRPLSSMSPTIVLKDGQPVLTVGAGGGPKIITQVLMTIIRRLDFGEPLAGAVAAPRIHHQWRPNELTVERTMPNEIVDKLQGYGHHVRRQRDMGVMQALERAADGTWIGVYDPRVPGAAGEGRRERQ